MTGQTILVDKSDHTATITLNRPERLNAVNERLFAELLAALDDVSRDEAVRVVVLTGAGRAFCASADLSPDEGGEGVIRDVAPPLEYYKVSRNLAQQVTLGLRNLQKPTIAMVNGLAIGDGFDWVLACDLRVGSEHARFMNAFVRMALLPVTGGCWLLPRYVGLGKALELLYTGDWLSAEEAKQLGILNRLVQADQLAGETMALARKLAAGPPLSLAMMKRVVYKGLEVDFETGLELAVQAEALLSSTEDHREAVAAFREKRPAQFAGR